MLVWTKIDRKQYGGTVVSTSYEAQLPGWGRVTVHPYVHCSGAMFLTCDSVGLESHPRGRITPEDALKPAEAELERALKQYIAWCGEGLAALHNGQEQ